MKAAGKQLSEATESRKPSLLLITSAKDADAYSTNIVTQARAYLSEVPMVLFPEYDAMELLPQFRRQLPQQLKRTIEDKLSLGCNVVLAVPQHSA